jgi:hypothetical protein
MNPPRDDQEETTGGSEVNREVNSREGKKGSVPLLFRCRKHYQTGWKITTKTTATKNKHYENYCQIVDSYC